MVVAVSWRYNSTPKSLYIRYIMLGVGNSLPACPRHRDIFSFEVLFDYSDEKRKMDNSSDICITRTHISSPSSHLDENVQSHTNRQRGVDVSELSFRGDIPEFIAVSFWHAYRSAWRRRRCTAVWLVVTRRASRRAYYLRSKRFEYTQDEAHANEFVKLHMTERTVKRG